VFDFNKLTLFFVILGVFNFLHVFTAAHFLVLLTIRLINLFYIDRVNGQVENVYATCVNGNSNSWSNNCANVWSNQVINFAIESAITISSTRQRTEPLYERDTLKICELLAPVYYPILFKQ
jgi:hypothetical protein